MSFDLAEKIGPLINSEWKYSWHWPMYSSENTDLEDKALENAKRELNICIERLHGLQKAINLINESKKRKEEWAKEERSDDEK